MKRLSINILINQESIFEAIEKVQQFLQANSVDKEVGFNVRLAMEELLVNLIDHTSLGSADNAYVDTLINTDIVKLIIRDLGPPFNPLEQERPDLDQDIEDRPVGGLGIFLLKESAESMHYEYTRRQNQLSIAWRRNNSPF